MADRWRWLDYPDEAVDPDGNSYTNDRFASPSDVKRLIRGEVQLLENDADDHVLTRSESAAELIAARCIHRGTHRVTNPGEGEDGELDTLVSIKDKHDIVLVLTWRCRP